MLYNEEKHRNGALCMVCNCKICGGRLNIRQGETIAECEYCGVKQTIPNYIHPQAEEIYAHANSYLMNNEFDKAEYFFNQILFINKQDSNAYWSILLCRYGVTYVKDPASGQYVPTCNRTLSRSILQDDNFRLALTYANDEQRAFYSQSAQIIDNIQKGILAISQKEKPFDIFISYKETDANGARTRDSVVAQDLYTKLTAEGYKVFFSRITLENKIGTEYEPYIYAALASSKVMITVTSSKENIESVWVKNEWSRFMSFAASGHDKTIIPLYYNMSKSDLPQEFANLISHNIQENGFQQELLRGIRKLIPTPVNSKEQKKKRKKIALVTIAALSVISIILGICSIPWFMKLPEYNDCMELYNNHKYAEAAWAFEKMGDFRDSEEKHIECLKRWRNNVSTIATDNALGSSSTGSYYINPNGTVETFSYNPGNAHDNIEINQHGKVVSIGDDVPLNALYEDGYVLNSAENNELESDWENIVKISPVFNATSVALCDNGKLIYGDLQNNYNKKDNDNWLTPISDWENIVDFDCYTEKAGYGGLQSAAIVALDIHGNLHCVTYESQNNTIRSYDLVDNFSNVVDFDIDITFDYSDYERQIVNYLNIVAITEDGNIQSLFYGVFNEEHIENVVDVELVSLYSDNYDSTETYCYFTNDGKLYIANSENYVLEDVVYIKDYFIVTRSGTIYREIQEPVSTDAKTKVLDEWIERMN